MSTEALQHDLLVHFYKFQDLQKDQPVKLTISQLLHKYNQSNESEKSAIEFQYGINDLETFNATNITDDELISRLVALSKSRDFQSSFKRKLVEKQYELKRSYKDSFQRAKVAKYSFNDDDTALFIEEESPSKTQQFITPNAKLISTTKKITSSLIQTSQILQSSLIQSQLNLDELNIQSDALTDLGNKYTSLKGVLEKSDGFINDIKTSTERDKKRMYYALGFFGACVAWIVYRRLLVLPLKLVLNIVFYTFKLSLGVFGLVSRKNAAVIEADFVHTDVISPTLVDDGEGEIIYETSESGDTAGAGVAIESAVYDESDGEDATSEKDLKRIVDEL